MKAYVIGLILVISLGSIVYIYKYRWWPMASYLKQEATFLLPGYAAQLKGAVDKLSSRRYESLDNKILAVREWVNSNSLHLIDSEHDSYAFHLPSVIKKLNEHDDGLASKPHLSCGPRAYAMKQLLDRMEIESRIVDIFVIRPEGNPDSHTLIEVYNDETGSWQLEDPDFNIGYIDNRTGEKLSAYQAINNPDSVGFQKGSKEIENYKNLLGTIDEFFVLGVLYRYSYVGGRSIFYSKKEKEQLGEIQVSHEQSEFFPEYIKWRDFSPVFDFFPGNNIDAKK